MNFKSFIILFLATSLFVLHGCTEEQSELNLSSIENFVTISGKVVYNTGVDAESTNYTLETTRPAAGRKVFVEVAYSQYVSGSTGNKIFETETDENGEFSIEIPTISVGITANLRLEVFTANFNTYEGMEDYKPVFKTELRKYEISLPPLTGLKPGAFSFPNHIEYNSTVIDLEGFEKEITLSGNVQLAYESAYRVGAYQAAPSRTVELEIVYDPFGSPQTFTYGATTNTNGDYSLTIPLKSYKDGFRINKISTLGFAKEDYTHYSKPGESINLKGAYLTTNATGFPLTLINIVEGIPCDVGRQYLKFTPNYNNGLPSLGKPETWSDDLPGWTVVTNSTHSLTIKGAVKLAVQSKNNSTSNWEASWTSARNRDVKVSVNGISYDYVTDAAGEFTFTLPSATIPASRTISIIPEDDEVSVNFIHHPNTSTDEESTIKGRYFYANNANDKIVVKSEEGNIYEVAISAKMFFTPNIAPTGWGFYNWNAIINQ
ncbi:MAG: hypothetical protein BGO29_04285 [Bacteroidales bacterium 36-12]|nr:MAG: hypothetical protein BGO29_04285 [Bacteroidales bacterium 36-12]